MKPRKSDRGAIRQLASQMFMLFSAHRNSGEQRLCGIDRRSLDQFYYDRLDFDPRCKLAIEFEHILDKLSVACEPLKKKLAGHEAIHLMLLASQLSENEMCDSTTDFSSALEVFRSRVAADRKDRRGDYWVEYGQLTQTGSHTEDVILRRQTFFHKRMNELLNSTS